MAGSLNIVFHFSYMSDDVCGRSSGDSGDGDGGGGGGGGGRTGGSHGGSKGFSSGSGGRDVVVVALVLDADVALLCQRWRWC